MSKITLFHGTFEKNVIPTYGLGEAKHDYGMGFYLTDNIELAKEWAVCRPNVTNGWVHQYELDTEELKILDFQEKEVLSWLAELLSLGGLGIQYCIKSPFAYSKLHEVENGLISVDYAEFREKYNQRDISSRQKMRELVDSDANKVTKVFSTLF